MPDIVIVDGTDAAGEVAGEVPPVLETEATEAVAEAAVEIAEIEADKEIAIAEIQAEVASEAIEASEEAVIEEHDEWRRNIETQLAETKTQQAEILSTLQALKEPLPSPLESPESPEAMLESQEAPEPEPVKKRPHHRLI